MSLEIEVDPHGIARLPFAEVRDKLALEGRTFGETDLDSLHYHQIRMAAMANAGVTACSLDMVVEAKKRRRRRFTTGSEDDLHPSVRYLSSEGMLGDVKAEIRAGQAVRLDGLAYRTRLWLVLNCVRNHTDLPSVRLKEASHLAQGCMKEGSLSEDFVRDLQWEIDHMVAFYPHGISSEQVRAKVAVNSELLLDLLNEKELDVCAGVGVIGYSCTSDCYRTT